MCGISGLVSLNGAPVQAANLRLMTSKLLHRGPDGSDVWISTDRKIGFGHTRLAVIDLNSGSNQPFHSNDGRYTIVYNGEIYNFIEIKKTLELAGCRFTTDGDTEVLVEAWRVWGKEMLTKLNGMWAFAIHDHASHQTFLARDRFGVKPLYYSSSKDFFVFASEIRAMEVLQFVDRSFDREIVTRTLFDSFSIEAGEKTYRTGVKRLPAGHFLVLDEKGEKNVSRWWKTNDHLVECPPEEGMRVDRFRELFFDAVKLRMRSDVPIGVCLSGGFDSSVIACTIDHITSADDNLVRSLRNEKSAFIASMPGARFDETNQALKTAKYANFNPVLSTVGLTDYIQNIESVLEDLDEAYITLPTSPWLLYQTVASHGVRVTLDGHGADELFGGYQQAGGGLKTRIREAVESWDSLHRKHSIKDAAKSSIGHVLQHQFLRHHKFKPPARLATPFDNDLLPKEWGLFNKRQYKMFHSTILPTILRNFDRMSMAHGVESRMPFMDWRLVTYVLSLPDTDKLKEGYTKYVAREAMSGLMPEEVRVQKQKIGFSSPLDQWLNSGLGDWALSIFSSRNPDYDSIVDTHRLVQCISEWSKQKTWTWRRAEKLWPYIQMKWKYNRQ
jgi:asparagine synthase (glutamine-hydrolysing)